MSGENEGTRTERTRTERTRTYVRRRGRMTRGQARALEDLSARYLVPWEGGPLELPALFGRNAPLGLEIGFGMGQALVDWALRRPGWNLLGVEVYEPGLGAAMLGLEKHDIGNVRLLDAPAEDILEHAVEDASLSEVRIFFPDPWPKKRHHKRRLIQPHLAGMLARRLRPDGVLWVATDWQDYACWIADVLDGQPELQRAAPGAPTTSHPTEEAAERPQTRFEDRGLRLGHQVRDLRYVRKR